MPEPLALSEVALEGTGAIGELEAVSHGEADDVRAVSLAVRREGDAVERLDAADVGRKREVAVGHRHLDHAHGCKSLDALFDRAVQASPRLPDHERPWERAQTATSLSSHTTATGGARPPPALARPSARTSASRSASPRAAPRRRFACANALTGTRTAWRPQQERLALPDGLSANGGGADGHRASVRVLGRPVSVVGRHRGTGSRP